MKSFLNMAKLSMGLGIDWGSCNIKIYLRDRGLVVNEDAVMARIKRKRWVGVSAPMVKAGTVVAWGKKAHEMMCREPRQIEVIAPIRNGVINDLEAAEKMAIYYVKLVREISTDGWKLLKPEIIIGMPASVSFVQKRAIRSVFLSAGARQVVIVDQPVLISLGLGIGINESGTVIIDIGGNKSEVSVISMGGVVVSKMINVGSKDVDDSIINYIKMRYSLIIGGVMAEKIKISDEAVVVRGMDLEKSLPKSIKVTKAEIEEAIGLVMSRIVRLVKEVIDETPPELMEDILKKGLIMVGGGAKLFGLRINIENQIKIVTRIAERGETAAVMGAGRLIEEKNLLSEIKTISGYGK